MDTEEKRACTSCSVVLPLSKYKKRGTREPGMRHTMCNRCLYVKYTRPEAERKTILVQAYKLEQGCADCGYDRHPAALEFDHRPGTDKKFNVMEKVGSYKIERIWEEIAKCEVVCANCHAIRTSARRVLVGVE